MSDEIKKADDLWRLPPYETNMLGVVMAKSEVQDWGIVLAHIPNAWKKTRGKGIRIGICDTGKPVHEDLDGAIVAAKDFTGSASGVVDRQGHSTHVCAIIGARQNDKGVVGVGPEDELVAAKVLGDDGSGSSQSVSNGVSWCVDQGCDVINLSLGSSQPDPVIRKAIQYARSKGVFVVAAGGNSGPGENTVDYPGQWPEVIAVGAINKLLELAKFSSRGPQIDVAAPGQDILSAYLNNTYAKLSGTSMAAPFVAGCVGLILAYHKQNGTQPPKTVDDMIAALTQGSTDAGPPGKDPWFGNGIVDVEHWFSENPPPPNGDQPPPNGNGGIMDFFMKYILPLIMKLIEYLMRGNTAAAEKTFATLQATVEKNRVAILFDWSRIKPIVRLILPWLVGVIEDWLNKKTASAQAKFKKMTASVAVAAKAKKK